MSALSPVPLGRRSLPYRLWRVVVSTFGACLRYRVTGLAAEAAFFAVLSVPPLIFGLVGSIGLFARFFSADELEAVRDGIINLAQQGLTDRAVNSIVKPTLSDVIDSQRFDVVSVGFFLALWSGSRALNVFIDTVTIMHGLGGHRGIVKTRAMSFGVYVLALLSAAVGLPLVVAGPELVDALLPPSVGFLNAFYWPLVILLGIFFLTTLYHVSLPIRAAWRYYLPGAIVSMAMWVAGSAALRWTLTATAGESRSIYGPLSAPITVLLWLYLVALAVLIGAALNASVEAIFPRTNGEPAPPHPTTAPPAEAESQADPDPELEDETSALLESTPEPDDQRSELTS